MQSPGHRPPGCVPEPATRHGRGEYQLCRELRHPASPPHDALVIRAPQSSAWAAAREDTVLPGCLPVGSTLQGQTAPEALSPVPQAHVFLKSPTPVVHLHPWTPAPAVHLPLRSPCPCRPPAPEVPCPYCPPAPEVPCPCGPLPLALRRALGTGVGGKAYTCFLQADLISDNFKPTSEPAAGRGYSRRRRPSL